MGPVRALPRRHDRRGTPPQVYACPRPRPIEIDELVDEITRSENKFRGSNLYRTLRARHRAVDTVESRGRSVRDSSAGGTAYGLWLQHASRHRARGRGRAPRRLRDEARLTASRFGRKECGHDADEARRTEAVVVTCGPSSATRRAPVDANTAVHARACRSRAGDAAGPASPLRGPSPGGGRLDARGNQGAELDVTGGGRTGRHGVERMKSTRWSTSQPDGVRRRPDEGAARRAAAERAGRRVRRTRRPLASPRIPLHCSRR